MADQDFLPRRPFAVLPPEPGGFEAALARGRRRRRRTTGGGVLASVLVVALAMNIAGSSPDSAARLEFNKEIPNSILDDPRLPAPGTVDDAADEPAAAEEAGPEAKAPADTTGGVTPRSARPPGATAVAPSDGATPATQSRPVRPRAKSSTRRPAPPAESVDTNGYVDCVTNGLEVGQWCLQAYHEVLPENIDSGDATLSLSVCLSDYARSQIALEFPTEQQVDFEITRQGSDTVLWQWAYQAEFDQRATADTVTAGDCRVYAVIWPQGSTDNDGFTIRESDEPYVLTAKTLASNSELRDNNSARYTIPKTS